MTQSRLLRLDHAHKTTSEDLSSGSLLEKLIAQDASPNIRVDTLIMRFIVELFRHQVELHPDSIALEDQTFGGSSRQLTYRELNDMSDRLSSELGRRGVRRNDIVPILSSRCPGSIIAILAVLKLRACYVPIELDTWGKDRVDSVLRRTKARLVITTASTDLVEGWIDRHEFLFLGLDGHQRQPSTSPVSPAPSSPNLVDGDSDGDVSQDWAYLIFTSGTTGVPKGVVVGQASISRLVQERDDTVPFNLNAGPGSRVLLIFSFAFDGEFSTCLLSCGLLPFFTHDRI